MSLDGWKNVASLLIYTSENLLITEIIIKKSIIKILSIVYFSVGDKFTALHINMFICHAIFTFNPIAFDIYNINSFIFLTYTYYGFYWFS